MLFSERLKEFIRKIEKNKSNIARDIGCTIQFVSRHSKQQKEPDIIVFLRKFILTYNLTAEELYDLIVGESPKNANDYFKRISELENKITTYKMVIENLNQKLDSLSTKKKVETSTDNCNEISIN